MKKNLILLVLIILSFSVKAQKHKFKYNHYYIETQYQYGIIFEQLPRYKMFLKDHIQAFEINIGKTTTGKHLWERVHKYPYYGLGLHYADFGNPDILGKSISLYPFIKLPIIRKNKFQLHGDIRFGLAYLTKCFDVDNNIYNLAIGSHVNIYANLSLSSQIRLSKNLHLMTGFGLTHFSNGTMQVPNLGINIISPRIGLQYEIPDYKTPVLSDEIPEFEKRNEFVVIGSIGAREIYPVTRKKYLTGNLILNLGRVFGHDKRAGIGIDLMYESNIHQELVKDSIENIPALYSCRSGVHASYDIIFSKLSFFMHLGFYTYTKIHPWNFFYERIGLTYKINENLFSYISLKVHYVKADYISVGLAYAFKINTQPLSKW